MNVFTSMEHLETDLTLTFAFLSCIIWKKILHDDIAIIRYLRI